MPRFDGRAAPWLTLLVLGVAPGFSGCSPSDPLARAGVEIRPPAGWKSVAAATWPVPGTPLAAWSGPGGSSLVVSRGLPAPETTARALAGALVNRLENLPGLRVVRTALDPDGLTGAALVEVTAPGAGDSLAPTGIGRPVAVQGRPLVPTRRVVVVIPRADDTISIVWHAPESEADALATQISQTLRSLKVRRGQASNQSY